MLHVDPARDEIDDMRVGDLPRLLVPGDVLVVNDAATIPASLAGTTATGAAIEARLMARLGAWTFAAVLFGAGDWRARTEDRPAPPRLAAGDALRFGDLDGRIARVWPESPRLVDLALGSEIEELAVAIQRHGRPIQYSYVKGDLAPWHVQTLFGARPWAFEPPSAGRPLTWGLLRALRARGVALATVTHAAGISSTGDASLDALLPLPERYDIPRRTVTAVSAAKAAGRKVVAAGTSVVRALEGCFASHGRLVTGEGVTDLRLGPGFRPRVVDALFTGMHEPGTSHFELLRAFIDDALLARAHARAESGGYLGHEMGDSSLILPS
ncbi:MAG: S-adenosylmethionine:tRNA ribosyltransferase-isomerase [Acidobacteriota bacterium]